MKKYTKVEELESLFKFVLKIVYNNIKIYMIV